MHDSLQREVANSIAVKRTTEPLRRFVLGMVDRSLREFYGDNYSDRCFQSSMAIKDTLGLIGIDCRVWSGHVCFMRVTLEEDKPKFGWAGFWDQDSHVWAYNEFGELIDLTISLLHQHPASASGTELPIPAIWWDDVSRWPPVMLYMPQGNPVAEFSVEETAATEDFMRLCRTQVGRGITAELRQGYSGAVLSGPESLSDLTTQQHPWVLLCSHAQQLRFPSWVENRIQELQRQFERQQR